jgi:hypothetical protein
VSNAELEGLVDGLALQSYAQLLDPVTAPKIPTLYTSKIRYRNEPAGREIWQSAYETSQRGQGDCEDLVAYRLAELWRDGIRARARVLTISPMLRHVVVQHRDGTLEDPSKMMGMKSP